MINDNNGDNNNNDSDNNNSNIDSNKPIYIIIKR